jgi:putative transposase
MQFLPTCDGDMTLAQLNGKLTKWIDEEYHATVHNSTHQTPLARYLKHAHLIREAPKDLHDYFRIHVIRKVDRDRTVSLGGRLYEAPICLIGKTITLLHHEDDPLRVEALYNGTSHGMLVPLDLNINCRIRRQSNRVHLLPKAGSSSLPASPSTPSFPPLPQEAEKYTGGKLFGEVSHEL